MPLPGGRGIRAHPRIPFVTRASEKCEGKAAGAKRPEAWLDATVRTFWADNAAIALRSRPQ